MGAEMAIEHINAQGGIKALGGAKMKLRGARCGDTTEKAKNAAQRMVAQETDLVAAPAPTLSSFTLAVTEVTERAELPVLTLSYSDQITDARLQVHLPDLADRRARRPSSALPTLMKLAETATGKQAQDGGDHHGQHRGLGRLRQAPKRESGSQKLGLKLVVDEIFTPPLSDATPLIQKVRSARPDLLLFLPTAVSDAKLVLEKMNEFGLGQGRIPMVSFSITIAEPDMLQSVSKEAVQGIMTVVANWGSKGQEELIAELKAKYKEPWMTQNVVSTYGDMWIDQGGAGEAGKADREAVAQGHPHDGCAARRNTIPGGELKFDEKGRRVGAGVVIVQWQSACRSPSIRLTSRRPRRSGRRNPDSCVSSPFRE